MGWRGTRSFPLQLLSRKGAGMHSGSTLRSQSLPRPYCAPPQSHWEFQPSSGHQIPISDVNSPLPLNSRSIPTTPVVLKVRFGLWIIWEQTMWIICVSYLSSQTGHCLGVGIWSSYSFLKEDLPLTSFKNPHYWMLLSTPSPDQEALCECYQP